MQQPESFYLHFRRSFSRSTIEKKSFGRFEFDDNALYKSAYTSADTIMLQ